MTEPKTLSEQKHEAILRAAADEFQEAGFQSTSMDRIAERAGVSKRTVYNHFSSKNELFKAISKRLLEHAHLVTVYPFDHEETLERQLRDIGRREIELLSSEDFTKLSRVMLAECIRSPEMAREIFSEIREGESGIARWIRQAADAGRLRVDDPVMAADQFTALIKAFVFWPQLVADAPAPSELAGQAVVDSAVRMFLDHYRV
ncbi:MAG: TetR/AcrR family transcriptional regulator [Candidatus Latescibacterota bacterium]|nr:MAG: TetR/AcrR family transcriptional regulator [Candidatus Latescibacterota bacterium]